MSADRPRAATDLDTDDTFFGKLQHSLWVRGTWCEQGTPT